jgi:hypothetical protein
LDNAKRIGGRVMKMIELPVFYENDNEPDYEALGIEDPGIKTKEIRPYNFIVAHIAGVGQFKDKLGIYGSLRCGGTMWVIDMSYEELVKLIEKL